MKMKECFVCKTKLTNQTKFICKNCGKLLCGKHSFQYVDGNNISITKNSSTLCFECYKKTYKE